MNRFSLIVAQLCVALLPTLIATDTALAQGMGGGQPAQPPIPDVDKESLIFNVPQRWFPFSRSTDEKDETFVFPAGDSPEDWDEMMRIEQFKTTLGVTSAMQVYQLKKQGNSQSCSQYSDTLLHDRAENGYSMAMWSESCDLPDSGTRIMLTKAIAGAERLYVVTRVWNEPPRERDLERWQQTLIRMYVCDPNTGVNPCTPPGGPGGPGGGRRR